MMIVQTDDAAGRLVKEGDKVYSYGWLDKILSVQENGKQTASFDYHIGGQIASATTATGTENFRWDGLALIHRGKTAYVNEPYVTGGNPVLAFDPEKASGPESKVLFTDILGTTLGAKEGDQFNRNRLTAFGESSNASFSTENSFFTGKPFIGELGYALLFRNYRAEQGKWQSADPLGYPDGWNNLAYVNNFVSMYYDQLGGTIGNGVWEWESSGSPDDQRQELYDENLIGGSNPIKVTRTWKLLTTITLGNAYTAESLTTSYSMTTGFETGFNYGGVLTINSAQTTSISITLSVGKGEKAEVAIYQMVETYEIYTNGVVTQTIVAGNSTTGRVVKGWKWLE